MAVDQRDVLADVLLKDINAALVRTHGRITWSPGWSRNSDVDPAVAVTPDGIAITIQLLRGTRYEPWPTETREIEQRYRDAPPATLRVPTLLSFAGWKTAAWMDRGAARDLYDLWALNKVGALNAESAALFATHGPTSSPPRSWMFKRAPSAVQWQAQLAGQTRLTVSAADALEAVRTAWAAAVGEDWP
ncbi:MAG: nucleotidyl transferase AbiEii/AbiGii toxin family protein [Mycobacteriaceae bacterium]